MMWKHIALLGVRALADAYGFPERIRAQLQLIEDRIDRMGAREGTAHLVVSWLAPDGTPRLSSLPREAERGQIVSWLLEPEARVAPLFVLLFGAKLQVVSIEPVPTRAWAQSELVSSRVLFGRFMLVDRALGIDQQLYIEAEAV
jgi:hypothetical protein